MTVVCHPVVEIPFWGFSVVALPQDTNNWLASCRVVGRMENPRVHISMQKAAMLRCRALIITPAVDVLRECAQKKCN